MDKRTELALELGQTIYTNTINSLQARLEQQAKELVALRGFAKNIVEHCGHTRWIEQQANKFKLIDKDGNPTKLLTGD